MYRYDFCRVPILHVLGPSCPMRLFPRMCPGLLVPYTSFSLSVPFPRAFLSCTLLSLYFLFPAAFLSLCLFSSAFFPYAKTKNAPCRFYSGRGIFMRFQKGMSPARRRRPCYRVRPISRRSCAPSKWIFSTAHVSSPSRFFPALPFLHTPFPCTSFFRASFPAASRSLCRNKKRPVPVLLRCTCQAKNAPCRLNRTRLCRQHKEEP